MLNLLSRTSLQVHLTFVPTGIRDANVATEIYRIVSAKTLDNGGDAAQANLGAGTNISLSKPADEGATKGGKCC